MFEGYVFYAITATSIFIIVILGILGASRWVRAGLVTSFLVFLPIAYMTTVDLLSRPRPVELMLEKLRPNPEKAQVLSMFIVEKKYIMLLLMWDGLDYPRYFRWDWNQKMAEQLVAAKNGAKGENGKEGQIEMIYPFDPSLERREFPWAHPIPQYKEPIPKSIKKQQIYKFKREG